eukprot:538821_1
MDCHHLVALFLIIKVSSRNELSQAFNTWTSTIGWWDYSSDQFEQKFNHRKNGELILLDTQWYNADGRLSINYSFSIDFMDECDGSAGIGLYNGKSASYCEYYFFAIECENDDYFIYLSRGKVASRFGKTLQYELLKFPYVNNKEYILSITARNGNAFNVSIDSIPHLSYADDDDGYAVHSEYSGYIELWSDKNYKTTATYLEISGIPTNVSSFVTDDNINCVSLSPTQATQDPTTTPTSPSTISPSYQTTVSPTILIGIISSDTVEHDGDTNDNNEITSHLKKSISFLEIIIICVIGVVLLTCIVCVFCCIKRRKKPHKDRTNLNKATNHIESHVVECSPSLSGSNKMNIPQFNMKVSLQLAERSDNAVRVPPVPDDSDTGEELRQSVLRQYDILVRVMNMCR